MTQNSTSEKQPRPVRPKSSSRNPAKAAGAVPASSAKAGKKKRPVDKDDSGDTGRLGTVVVRNEFYRDGYRSILRIAVIQSVMILALIALMFYVAHLHQPENRYFATTEDGRLVPMVALNQPNLSTPALMSWVAQASTEVMTFGFNDYRRRLQEASRNFTRLGWESFTQALQRSRIIEVVEQNQQVLTAVPQGAPVLVSEGLVQGRYQWIVQIPIILTYQSGVKTRSDSLLINLVIVRVPRLESPAGVGINQWLSSPR